MKKIKLQDMRYQYEYDEITCFEHPMIVLFDYLNPGLGFCYALLSKLRGIYIQEKETEKHQGYNVREFVLKEVDRHFGITMEEQKCMSYKKIIKYLNNNTPVIMGVNLKDIFYSSYYAEHDWVHWFLIKGYKQRGNLVTLLDNTQFENVGHKYEDFNIPFDIVKNANKSYIKRYGSEYSNIVFRKSYYVDIDEIIIYILNEYLKVDLSKKENYRQSILIKMYADMSVQNISVYGRTDKAEEEFVNELRKKMININKYRVVFLNGISDYMQKSGFNIQMAKDYDEFNILIRELNTLWHKNTMKAAVKIMHGERTAEIIDEEIICKEINVQNDVRRFVEYLTKKMSEKKSGLANKEESSLETGKDNRTDMGNRNIRFENNSNNIISNTGQSLSGKATFTFDGTGVYNWWDMDNAPKMILKNTINQRTGLVVDLCIHEYREGNFEAGAFVREKSTGRSLMIGIENEKYLVISEIGREGHKLNIDKQDIFRIFIREQKGNIEFGINNIDEKNVMFVSDDIHLNDCEIGIVCKTWSSNMKLEVEFVWKWIKQ